MITVQYLEDVSDIAELGVEPVVEKLRAAHERLPFSHLLIGWRVPGRLLEACRAEAERLGVRFLRWHPLLTGDGVFQSRLDWRVVGLTGSHVPGWCNLPEFTFACPNHPQAQEAIGQRIEGLIGEGMYQGFFLDRVRFPSPASDLLNELGCFCEHCQRKAASLGLDLERVRQALAQQAAGGQGRQDMVWTLLGAKKTGLPESTANLLQDFLAFRTRSVADFVAQLAARLREAEMEIGLDCFSPSLAMAVGQDLESLSGLADWIKIMSYAHVLGPAGLPFELLGLLDGLVAEGGLAEGEALVFLGQALSLPLPATRRELEKGGLSPQALEVEVRRGVQASRSPVLAGFELVEIEGVAELNRAQIAADLEAVKRAGAAGLSISWDLWRIPLERLDLVRRTYLEA